MKILALERELPDIKAESFTASLLEAEAERVWELSQEGTLREAYFRMDRHAAVLVLESTDVETAQRTLDTLPLVKAGLITFEVIPLGPYSGYARLFARQETSARL
jgi:muconolactone delta-isomerase